MTVRTRRARPAMLVGAVALFLPGVALAEAPADNQSKTAAFDSPPSLNKAIKCAGDKAESQIVVPGTAVGAYLSDVDITTSIDHDHSGDLQIDLIAPNGRAVRLVSAKLNNHALNEFSGTLWDDSASVVAASFAAPSGIVPSPQSYLAPRGGLGSLVGINPAGTWTLRVTDTDDDCSPADTKVDTGGVFNRWSLALTTRAGAPTVGALAPLSVAGDKPISSAAPAELAINVANASGRVWDVNVTTKMVHENPSELKVEVEHLGRKVVLTDSVSGPYEFFGGDPGRLFDDSASAELVKDVPPGPVVPFTGLAAFRGLDPNGIWTLRVIDDTAAGNYGGTLNGWSLALQTAALEGTTTVISVPQTPIVGKPIQTTTPGTSSTSQTTSGAPQSQPQTTTAPVALRLAAASTLRWKGLKLTGALILKGTSPAAKRLTVVVRAQTGALVRPRGTKAKNAVVLRRPVSIPKGNVSVKVAVGRTLRPGTYRVEILDGKSVIARSNVRAR